MNERCAAPMSDWQASYGLLEASPFILVACHGMAALLVAWAIALQAWQSIPPSHNQHAADVTLYCGGPAGMLPLPWALAG